MQSTFELLQKELRGLYPDTEIRSFSFLIAEKLTGLSRTEILINKNTLFSVNQRQTINRFIEKLKNFEPIQYILGETEFYGLTFYVNESVLIPRPETEELVDWIRNENNTEAKLKILDIGTGSGCIAISLKHEFRNATIEGYDISDKAIETAIENSKLNNEEVTFSKVNILNSPVSDAKWDIIVSNPPYITEQEKDIILPNVLNHEPHLALFVPDSDPLLFYREIGIFAGKHLAKNGKLYFEINREYGKATFDMISEMGFTDIELRKDISGNDRMIRANFNA